VAQTFEIWPIFEQVLKQLWEQYGPFAALLILGFIGHEWMLYRLWSARLRDKDHEIERLVNERNKLQDVILAKRISSTKKNTFEKEDDDA
jgi:hypothetical protein